MKIRSEMKHTFMKQDPPPLNFPFNYIYCEPVLHPVLSRVFSVHLTLLRADPFSVAHGPTYTLYGGSPSQRLSSSLREGLRRLGCVLCANESSAH